MSAKCSSSVARSATNNQHTSRLSQLRYNEQGVVSDFQHPALGDMRERESETIDHHFPSTDECGRWVDGESGQSEAAPISTASRHRYPTNDVGIFSTLPIATDLSFSSTPISYQHSQITALLSPFNEDFLKSIAALTENPNYEPPFQQHGSTSSNVDTRPSSLITGTGHQTLKKVHILSAPPNAYTPRISRMSEVVLTPVDINWIPDRPSPRPQKPVFTNGPTQEPRMNQLATINASHTSQSSFNPITPTPWKKVSRCTPSSKKDRVKKIEQSVNVKANIQGPGSRGKYNRWTLFEIEYLEEVFSGIPVVSCQKRLPTSDECRDHTSNIGRDSRVKEDVSRVRQFFINKERHRRKKNEEARKHASLEESEELEEYDHYPTMIPQELMVDHPPNQQAGANKQNMWSDGSGYVHESPPLHNEVFDDIFQAPPLNFARGLRDTYGLPTAFEASSTSTWLIHLSDTQAGGFPQSLFSFGSEGSPNLYGSPESFDLSIYSAGDSLQAQTTEDHGGSYQVYGSANSSLSFGDFLED